MSSASEQQILARLNRIEDKLDNIICNGCSKSAEHTSMKDAQKALADSIKVLEAARNENRGKMIIGMMLIGAAISYMASVFFQWVGKTMPQ